MRNTAKHLPSEVVAKIRKLLAEGDTPAQLSERFGVSASAIRSIRLGRYHALPV